MDVTNIEHQGMCSNTQREIEIFNELLKVVTEDIRNSDGTITLKGIVKPPVTHRAISDEFAVCAYFAERLGREGISIGIQPATDTLPEQFIVTLSGNALQHFLAAERSYEEFGGVQRT